MIDLNATDEQCSGHLPNIPAEARAAPGPGPGPGIVTITDKNWAMIKFPISCVARSSVVRRVRTGEHRDWRHRDTNLTLIQVN